MKDKALNQLYRQRYGACHRQYSLVVPFLERFFELALAGDDAGYAGLIVANSFMKREFGKKLIEAYYVKQTPAGTFKGCAPYRGFRELLARPDIDAVMISTPDHWHAVMAAAALRAGKDVSLEKPITRFIREGRLLADLAAKHQRVFRVDSEFRSLERFHRAVELVRNGRFGPLRTIRSGSPIEEFPEESESVTPVPPEHDYNLCLGPTPEVREEVDIIKVGFPPSGST